MRQVECKAKMQGVDLFCGAGGMSVGAMMSGIDIKYAVEMDWRAATTFKANHPRTKLFASCISNVCAKRDMAFEKDVPKIIFGGPPCQGFSTSNQKNRGLWNKNNWLYAEYLRLTEEIRPDWIVFENVKGLYETENGYFLEAVLTGFEKLGYTNTWFVLNAMNHGVPQSRNRLFIIGSLHGISIAPPLPLDLHPISVRDAIQDLPSLVNGDVSDYAPYQHAAKSEYARFMRNKKRKCWNNIVTKNSEYIIERYKHIPQGGNWQNIPIEMMSNYLDATRCHTGIYHRLREDMPSIVIGNFRKNMLVHPWENRGLSVREAARLQSFPDSFRFFGSIGFQQQQVGNAVPPLLAKEVFKNIMNLSK